MLYQSRAVGLDNLWQLWQSDSTAVISIRGTTQTTESWLANFYSAMVPAKGRLELGKDGIFDYKLATDERAAVHVGWIICLAYLSKDILPKIDSLYRSGTRNFLIVGHSQGGAISYLLTAYIRQLIKAHRLPQDLKIKTYCSAAPKPGNLSFAYEYESMTRNGWSFNVVNPADWVPETPVAVQTIKDLNPINPFVQTNGLIRNQKISQRIALNYVFARLHKPLDRAQRNHEKFLGRKLFKEVARFLPGLKEPKYVHSNHYVRTGQTIVLPADEAYFAKYPNDPEQLFQHHLHQPYLYLLEGY